MLMGTPSCFVRVSGCNLRCAWCDTKYASWNPEGQLRDVDELANEVLATETHHVVITGGEPMMFGGVTELSHTLSTERRHVTIETAGTVYREVTCDLMSISPKLSNSVPGPSAGSGWQHRHEATRKTYEVMRALVLGFNHQVKFVVCPETLESDLDEIDCLLQRIGPIEPYRVLLMPEGVSVDRLRLGMARLAPVCVQRGYRLSPRMHIELYGNTRGT